MSHERPLPSVHTKTISSPAPNGMGTGLFASSDIHTGEDVLRISSPFVAVLDTPRLDDTCSGCFGKAQAIADQSAELKACTGCQVVKYCDKTCQAKDWKLAHSLECPIFQKLAPRVLPNNARAMLRIILRSARRKYTSQEIDLFVRLETHIREVREQNVEQWERNSLSAKAVKMYSGSDMKEGVMAAIGVKLDLNAFNLTNALYDRIGLYLHPYAALINHSCESNSVVGFDGDELFVKAVRPIKGGEQVFISYIDASNPYGVRRRELLERYYFDCQCSKCFKGSDTPEDKYLTTTPDYPLLKATGQKVSSLMDAASVSDDPIDAVHKLKSAMQTLHRTSVWPITRQPSASLRDDLIATLLSAGRFKTAFMQAAIRYTRIDPVIYPHESHPIRHVHAWALAKLAIHISQGMETELDVEISLELFELNFSLIIWSVLNGLVSKERESCTVPSFKRMARLAFYDVHKEFIAKGLEPSSLEDEINREWKKLDGLVSVVLEKE